MTEPIRNESLSQTRTGPPPGENSPNRPSLPGHPSGGSGSAGLTSLTRWCRLTGVSTVTAWRFRRRGWLTTVNICGRVYVTEEACRDFVRRAEAGEFAQQASSYIIHDGIRANPGKPPAT